MRRDQLNYSIEKNILKEAYASNLQTVQVVITIVTAVFGVLGYLGFKGILAIKSDYARELEALSVLKLSMGNELQKQVLGLTAVRAELDQLAKKNQEQDRRLKTLEIMEKAGQLLQQENYVLALEYIDTGLALEPQNTKLLDTKSLCTLRGGRFAEAIEINKQSLAIERKNPAVIANCAESLLALGRADEFDSFYKEYKSDLKLEQYGALEPWLLALRGMVRNDIAAIRVAMQPFANNCSDGATPRIKATWSFIDTSPIIAKLQPGPLKSLMEATVEFLAGRKTKQDYNQILNVA